MHYRVNTGFTWGLLLAVSACILSCNKTKELEPLPVVQPAESALNIRYTTDNGSLLLNDVRYLSVTGYSYSVIRLSYYLSQLRLIRADSSTVLLRKYHYADADDAASNTIRPGILPEGDYIGIAFNIGLDPAQNLSNALPANAANLEMQWPVPMGGGYHFLKLEGYFRDSSGTNGYALHLGTNSCLRPVKLFRSFTVTAAKQPSLSLIMNVSEWYARPYAFDFVRDGNYIMGNDTAMRKIADNGADAFSFSP